MKKVVIAAIVLAVVVLLGYVGFYFATSAKVKQQVDQALIDAGMQDYIKYKRAYMTLTQKIKISGITIIDKYSETVDANIDEIVIKKVNADIYNVTMNSLTFNDGPKVTVDSASIEVNPEKLKALRNALKDFDMETMMNMSKGGDIGANHLSIDKLKVFNSNTLSASVDSVKIDVNNKNADEMESFIVVKRIFVDKNTINFSEDLHADMNYNGIFNTTTRAAKDSYVFHMDNMFDLTYTQNYENHMDNVDETDMYDIFAIYDKLNILDAKLVYTDNSLIGKLVAKVAAEQGIQTEEVYLGASESLPYILGNVVTNPEFIATQSVDFIKNPKTFMMTIAPSGKLSEIFSGAYNNLNMQVQFNENTPINVEFIEQDYDDYDYDDYMMDDEEYYDEDEEDEEEYEFNDDIAPAPKKK